MASGLNWRLNMLHNICYQMQDKAATNRHDTRIEHIHGRPAGVHRGLPPKPQFIQYEWIERMHENGGASLWDGASHWWGHVWYPKTGTKGEVFEEACTKILLALGPPPNPNRPMHTHHEYFLKFEKLVYGPESMFRLHAHFVGYLYSGFLKWWRVKSLTKAVIEEGVAAWEG